MNAKKNPTMKDVAKAAGVSLGTVSNVINGVPVRKESREKVEKAIKALHYEVNAYAQGFRKSQTGLGGADHPRNPQPLLLCLHRLCCGGGVRPTI